MSTKLFIRKNDMVQVMAGKDKGKQGKVLAVNIKDMKLTIEGVNMVKRHVKPTQTNPQGGINSKEAGVHYSNVQLLHPTTKKPTRATKFTRGKKGELVEKTAAKK
ncbi:MAG: 50S ribosomal protein L24 [Bdellovibrionales bacterium]|nr:50S ribosomal protein L24 [Bdellovibrionales bacterium]